MKPSCVVSQFLPRRQPVGVKNALPPVGIDVPGGADPERDQGLPRADDVHLGTSDVESLPGLGCLALFEVIGSENRHAKMFPVWHVSLAPDPCVQGCRVKAPKYVPGPAGTVARVTPPASRSRASARRKPAPLWTTVPGQFIILADPYSEAPCHNQPPPDRNSSFCSAAIS